MKRSADGLSGARRRAAAGRDAEATLRRTAREFLRSYEVVQHLIVLRTDPGGRRCWPSPSTGPGCPSGRHHRRRRHDPRDHARPRPGAGGGGAVRRCGSVPGSRRSMADMTRVAFAFAGWPIEALAVRHLVESKASRSSRSDARPRPGRGPRRRPRGMRSPPAPSAPTCSTCARAGAGVPPAGAQACGAQQGGVPLARELRLAAIVKSLVEIAGMENATFLAHGGGHDDASLHAQLEELAQTVRPGSGGFVWPASLMDADAAPTRDARRRGRACRSWPRTAPHRARRGGASAPSRHPRTERHAGDAGDAGAGVRTRARRSASTACACRSSS